MRDFLNELRHSVRLLARRPVLSGLAVLSLGLGIGVNSAIFTIVDAVLLRDVPMRAPDRVVEVYTSDSDGYAYSSSSYPDYLDLRRENDVFSELAAHTVSVATYDDGVETELLFGEEVSGNYFDFLGLPLALGRGFTPQEDLEPHPVVVLGHDFWQRRFAGRGDILGDTIELNGVELSVVGVAPAELDGLLPGLVADFWLPLAMHDRMTEDGGNDRRGSRSLFLQGRLRPGVEVEEAAAQLAVLAERLAAAYPESNEGRTMTLLPSSEVVFHPAVDGPLFGVAGVLMVLVALVLLIACSNIANLLLARAADRRREIALRLALGSSRRRLLRQLLGESVLLSGAGSLLGLLFAYWTVQLILGFQPPLPIPLSLDLAMGGRVLAFTVGLGLLTGIACGLAPALHATRQDLAGAIKDDSASAGRHYRRFGLRNALVVAQVAVSTVLLVGTGLFLRSLSQAQAIDPGYGLRHGAAVTLALGLGDRWDETTGAVLLEQLLERVRELPGVRSAAYAENLPLALSVSVRGVQPEGQEALADDEWPDADFARVGPGYFATLGVDLLRGRDFDRRDDAAAPPVAIVNDTAARRWFPGEDPIGKRLRFGTEEPWVEIVGMAETGKYRTLGEDPRPFVYVNHRQDYASLITLVAASAGSTPQDEQALVEGIREELDALAPGVPIFEQKRMSDHLDAILFPARLGASLLAAFGGLGLLLAAVGLYGVVAYAVSRRTREVGIRMAIGAGRGDVLGLVVREGMTLVAVGLAIGVGVALVGTRALDSLLYGIGSRDPVTFVAVAGLLLAVALLANLLPARRATRIQPVTALRQE